MDEIQKDWNKSMHLSRKAGYRDGISDGRESNYQKYFNNGYEQGFRNGFLLGKIKGVLSTSSTLTEQPVLLNEDLEKTRQGCCQLCKNVKLLLKPTDEIIRQQSCYVNNVICNFKDLDFLSGI